MPVNELTLVAQFDSRSADRSVNRFNRNLSGIERAAVKGTRGATRGIQNFERVTVQATSRMSGMFATLTSRIRAMGAVMVTTLGAAAVKVAADFERVELGMGALLGSMETGKKVFREVQQFALTSPFTFKDLAIGAQRITAVGFKAREILPTLKAMSTAVSALGGGGDRLNDLVRALGDIKAAGKLTGEELRQLKNAAIPAIDILTKAFGKSSAQIRKDMKNGLLDADSVIKALLKGLEDRFGEFGRVVEQTASVAFANFVDVLQKAADDILREDALPAITVAVKDLSRELSKLSSWYKENKTAVNFIVTSFVKLGAAAIAMKFLPGTLLKIGTALGRMVKWTVGLGGLVALIRFLNTPMLTRNALLFASAAGSAERATAALGIKAIYLWRVLKIRVAAGFTAVAGAAAGATTAVKLLHVAARLSIYIALAASIYKVATAYWDMRDAIKSARDAEKGQDNSRALLEAKVRQAGVNTRELRQEWIRGAHAGKSWEEVLRQIAFQMGEIKRKQGVEPIKWPEPPKEQSGLTDEELKKIAAAEKRALGIFNSVKVARLDGMDAVIEKYRQLREEIGVNVKALRALGAAEIIEMTAEWQKTMDKSIKEFNTASAGAYKDRQKFQNQQLQERIDFERETLELRLSTLDAQMAAEQDSARHTRDIRMAQLDGVEAQTVQQQLAVVAQRMEIEKEFINESERLQIAEIQRRMTREIEYLQFLAKIYPERARLITERVAAINEQMDADVLRAAKDAARDRQTAEVEAASQSARVIMSNTQRTFDQFKSSAGRVFDALLHKSESVWDALANSLKTAVLTALKEIVTSQIARMFTQLMTGQQVKFGGGATGGSGSPMDKIRQALSVLGLGSDVAYGGGGSGSGGGGNPTSIIQSLKGLLGGGGARGTAGVSGNVVLNGRTMAGNLFGPMAAFGGAGAGAGGLASLFFNSGSIALGGGAATTAAGIGGLGGILAGVATSPAAGIAGAGLAAYGIYRGGPLGIAMAAGGGALAGFQIGGPIGAAIGAAIGGGAALIRTLFKKAKDNIRSKIKNAYGVDIREKEVIEQITGIIKNNYGGNVTLGIASPMVRNLVELYAMQSGQTFTGQPGSPHPLSLVQSGGVISAAPSIYSQPSLNLMPPKQAAPGPTTIILDAEATERYWDRVVKHGIVNSPDAVQAASMQAGRQSTGRQETAAMQLTPGMITA